IACLAQWHQKSKRAWLIAAAALLGLVFLTKAEIFLAAFVTFAVGFIAEERLRRRRPRFTNLLIVTPVVFLPVILAFLLMLIRLTPGEALTGLAGSWRWVGDRQLLDLPYFKD